MDKTLIASSNVVIQSSPEKVWEVLTNPYKIKDYLFGTKVQTNWEVGSPILFQGNYNGQEYKDKGEIIENKKNKSLKYNYWSSFSELEDLPENYSIVSYKIEMITKSKVKFTWHQQGFSDEKSKCHTEQGLETMLKQIKKLSENS